MKFKLDENMPEAAGQVLVSAGHVVETVRGQNLGGAGDDEIAQHCNDEGLCLVTLDMDFANTLRYSPEQYPGIIVLRHPRLNLAAVSKLLGEVAAFLAEEQVERHLWIVQPGRVRIHESEWRT